MIPADPGPLCRRIAAGSARPRASEARGSTSAFHVAAGGGGCGEPWAAGAPIPRAGRGRTAKMERMINDTDKRPVINTLYTPIHSYTLLYTPPV